MIVEVAQISTEPGCIDKNTAKVITSINQAKSDGVDVVVFPELTIPGYMSMDLLLYPDYLRQNKAALDKIVGSTRGITAVVGFVDWDAHTCGPDGTYRRFNSAAIMQEGRLIGIEDKTLLPNYDVFYEARYFQTARSRRVYQIAGHKVGIEICEDLWDSNYPVKVSQDLVQKGAEILVNLSASPFFVNKRALREELIRKQAALLQVPFVYANLIGSQDGYDGQLVFDGQSLIVSSSGGVLGQAKAFAEDRLIVDLTKTKNEIKIVESSEEEQLYKALVLGISSYFKKSGLKRAIIGLSGGIDSAVTAALAVEALGADQVTGVSMPSKYSSEGSISDAQALADNLGINFKLVPIAKAYQDLRSSVENLSTAPLQDLTSQNIQARIRGLILMGLANNEGGMVISTGNKTEMALGYCTLYGDMNGGLSAISDLNKLRVFALARYINQIHSREIIPESSISKPPSAELTANQTDEANLGGRYDLIAPIVDKLIEEQSTVAELSQIYPEALVKQLSARIAGAEFKRRQAPPGIKVTPKSFGIGRRFPIAHEVKI